MDLKTMFSFMHVKTTHEGIANLRQRHYYLSVEWLRGCLMVSQHKQPT